MNQVQKDVYYASLRETGLEAASAKAAGVSLRAVQKEYEADQAFHEDCLDALEQVYDRYEQEAIRRAVDGVPKGVYYQGDRVDEELVFSDTLLAKILTGRRASVYGDKREITGANGGGIQVVIQEFTSEPDFL